MQNPIKRHYYALLGEADLPADTLERATRFFYARDSEKLWKLPIAPNEMIEAGKAVARAPSFRTPLPEAEPIPPLPDAVCQKLHALFDEGGVHAEAALFVLSQNLRICAFNRALDEYLGE